MSTETGRWLAAAAFLGVSVATTLTLRARDAFRRRAPVFLVHPAGEASVAATLARIASAGPGSLHIIIDFDRTMTCHWADAAQTRPMMTSYAVLQQRWPAAEKAQVDAISRHYYAIETDPKLSPAEKAPAMVEWHRLSNALAVEVGMTRGDVAEAVAAAGLALRPGVRELVAWCERHGVPLVVMSAGVADVVTEALRQLLGCPAALPPVVHVVSNVMLWGPDGRLAGFSEPVLHVFNKRAGVIEPGGRAAEALRGRPHAIVVGDSTGDATMADGDAACAAADGAGAVLKLGLLNHDVDALLPRYCELFDAVLTGDGPLDPLLGWLRAVEAGGSAGARCFEAAAAAAQQRRSRWWGWLDLGGWADRVSGAAVAGVSVPGGGRG